MEIAKPDNDVVMEHTKRIATQVEKCVNDLAHDLCNVRKLDRVNGINIMLNVAMNVGASQAVHYFEQMGHTREEILVFAKHQFERTLSLYLGFSKEVNTIYDREKKDQLMIDHSIESAVLNKKGDLDVN